MGTEKAGIYGTPIINTLPSFAYYDKYDGSLSLSSSTNLCSPTPSRLLPVSIDSYSTASHGWLTQEPSMLHPVPTHSIGPSTDPYFCFCQGGNTYTVPIDYASSQDTRRAPVLFDTRKWSPSPSLVGTWVTSKSQLPLMDMSSVVPHSHSDETFTLDHTPGFNMPPKPLVVPDLNLGFTSLTGYHQANLGTDFNRPTFPTCNAPASSSTSASIKDVSKFVSDERQSPIVIYRSPEKKGSGCRRSRRARAINIEGLWIDEDDVYSSAGQGRSMISVHECQWAKSSNPCGMWIVGSRSCVGAHTRKWHRQRHADSTARCLWDGCTKTMLKDSINRHVVTVHLGEGFHCRGCDQEFSRQDVYDQHVENDKVCRDAGAVTVYGTGHRVVSIGICQTSH